eukprot:1052912-Lingulodinium_polyedra.AAC.1
MPCPVVEWLCGHPREPAAQGHSGPLLLESQGGHPCFLENLPLVLQGPSWCYPSIAAQPGVEEGEELVLGVLEGEILCSPIGELFEPSCTFPRAVTKVVRHRGQEDDPVE